MEEADQSVKGRNSRFDPQHRFWHADLCLREAPIEGEALLYDNLISMDDKCLEISRATNILRGGALFGGLMSTVAVCFLVGFIVVQLHLLAQREYTDASEFAICVAVLVGTFAMLAPIALWGIRLDTRMPRDTPIRFNRQTGKVQAMEFKWTWNPFGHWPLQYKAFDWTNVQAEVQRQAGTDGRSYVIRYALVLCICKPGTFEVVDRVTLISNRAGEGSFPDIWNYVRQYMLEGPAHLVRPKPVPQGVSFRRSFFQYMRNLDPTEEGRDFRAECPWWLNVINGVIVVLTFWILIPMGLCHYTAMRFAPAVHWPDEGQVSQPPPAYPGD